MSKIIVIEKDDFGEILQQEFKIAILDLREQFKAQPMRELMNKKECADYLRCDVQKVNRYAKKGLPFEQFGGNPLFRKSSVDEWLKLNQKT